MIDPAAVAGGTAGAFEHMGPLQGFGRRDGADESTIAPTSARCSKWADLADAWSQPARASRGAIPPISIIAKMATAHEEIDRIGKAPFMQAPAAAASEGK